MLYMLALVGQPSLHGYYACMVCWVMEAPWINCRHILCRTSFSLIGVFTVQSEPFMSVLGVMASLDRSGTASWPFHLSIGH